MAKHRTLGSHGEKDLSTLVFGRLTVTKRYRRQTDEGLGLLWWCHCRCGEKLWVSAKQLMAGRSKAGRAKGKRSCGCLARDVAREKLRSFRGQHAAPLKLPFGRAARRNLFGSYQRQARRRRLEWAITWEDFIQLTTTNCHYCGDVPAQQHLGNRKLNGPCTYNGLDRVNNEIGYTRLNVVACCGVCNHMKRTSSASDFLAHVRKIARHTAQEIRDAPAV